MHAPCILSADDLGDFSGVCGKPSILEADDFLGACCRKALTPQQPWTILFPDLEILERTPRLWKTRKDRPFSRDFLESLEISATPEIHSSSDKTPFVMTGNGFLQNLTFEVQDWT